ncbi:MAG: antitoxin [Algicola sp.]|nr:antitoxin [Algicola sp.]
MATLQVKSIDDQLYKALGKRAAMENRSISQEVISIIKAHLATPSNKHKQASEQFLALCGTWDDDQSAQVIVEQVREARHRGDHREVDF